MKPELVETLTEGFISCFVDALIEILDKLNLETVSTKVCEVVFIHVK